MVSFLSCFFSVFVRCSVKLISIVRSQIFIFEIVAGWVKIVPDSCSHCLDDFVSMKHLPRG